ncbi:ap-1 complex subunit beta-1 [Anaeramoeba ignava]|uniref:Ap-1 complex subunit beta-1 n=1 Tax=Anaeramoeba ignava TaxID=1746090 RepID=A0A9Q0RCQ9_ANAIG|nr:ap-1 complex subunit beta-1 [Anaeramoeba ignava]
MFAITKRKGELLELIKLLQDPNESKRKEGVKRVVKLMTLGKDVSRLFTDVLGCMHTEDIELKKLVYIYLMKYSKFKPEQSILVVNTFVTDTQDPNPLIRALAIRSMGCIQVEEVNEYMCQPLRACLKDKDPYVRKTAVIAVVKLFENNPELAERQGFLQNLIDLLSDSNPSVVSNSVAALSEINESLSRPIFQINSSLLYTLFNAMNECNEWGQIFILDSLTKYSPQNNKETQVIIQRLLPKLTYSNPAIVLSTIRNILHFAQLLDNQKAFISYSKQVVPPLMTLLGSQHEIQFVALRNIILIVQRWPQLLEHEIKIFFCKYNDPVYIKLAKLDILSILVSDRNVDLLLREFKDYSKEVESSFARKSIQAIGLCAIKLEKAAERCVNTLIDLVKEKINFVQEIVVVIRDIFRKYPNRYEKAIGVLCGNLDVLDEPNAKAALIWMLGEYAEHIDNSRSEELLQSVLEMSTEQETNPDLRERAFMYWRLLTKEAKVSKEIVLRTKLPISQKSFLYEPTTLTELLRNISFVSSVYHKTPSSFINNVKIFLRKTNDFQDEDEDEDEDEIEDENENENQNENENENENQNNIDIDIDIDNDNDNDNEKNNQKDKHPQSKSKLTTRINRSKNKEIDLILFDNQNTNTNTNQKENLQKEEMKLDNSLFESIAPKSQPKQLLLTAQQGKGLTINGALQLRGTEIFFDISLTNKLPKPMKITAIFFNKNLFGLKPSGLNINSIVPSGKTIDKSIHCPLDVSHSDRSKKTLSIQVAIQNNLGVHYFVFKPNFQVFLKPNPVFDKKDFVKEWKKIPDFNEYSLEFIISEIDSNSVKQKLIANSFTFITQRKEEEFDIFYFVANLFTNELILVELNLDISSQTCLVYFRTTESLYIPFIFFLNHF